MYIYILFCSKITSCPRIHSTISCCVTRINIVRVVYGPNGFSRYRVQRIATQPHYLQHCLITLIVIIIIVNSNNTIVVSFVTCYFHSYYYDHCYHWIINSRCSIDSGSDGSGNDGNRGNIVTINSIFIIKVVIIVLSSFQFLSKINILDYAVANRFPVMLLTNTDPGNKKNTVQMVKRHTPMIFLVSCQNSPENFMKIHSRVIP